MSFLKLKLLRYNSVPTDPAETIDQGFRKDYDYSDQKEEDHDYGSFCLPDKYNLSLVEKGKRGYWTGKQYVRELLGRDDDMFSIASDADLDKQAHRARQIQKQCYALSKALRRYQKVNERISSREMALSALLRAYSTHDQGNAGEMSESCVEIMSRLGDVMESAALRRMDFDLPLMRLFQQVESLRGRGLADTLTAVKKLSRDQTSFRGAMLWMTDAARQLTDPDSPKQLEKYRQAQLMVRDSKREFEKSRDAVFVKVDMLAGSVCTMLSAHMLPYEKGLSDLWSSAYQDYSALLCWSRETMRHQYRLNRDIKREHERYVENREATSNDGKEEAAVNAVWSERQLMTIAGVEEPDDTFNGDFSGLGSRKGESSLLSSLSSREVQEELIKLAAHASSSNDVEESAVTSSEQLWQLASELELTDSPVQDEDDVRQITGDENQLEELFPMSESLRQRHNQDVQAEADVEKELTGIIDELDSFSAGQSPESCDTSCEPREHLMSTGEDMWQSMVNATRDHGAMLPPSVLDLCSDDLFHDALSTTARGEKSAEQETKASGQTPADRQSPDNERHSIAGNFLKDVLKRVPSPANSSRSGSRQSPNWADLFSDLDPLSDPVSKLSSNTLDDACF